MLKELEFLIGGTWKGQGEIPGQGAFTQEDRYEWALGGRFIRCRTFVSFPKLSFETEQMIFHNPEEDTLISRLYSEDGSFGQAVLSFEGKTLVYEGWTIGQGSGEWRSEMKRTGERAAQFDFYVKKDGDWQKAYEVKYHKIN